MNQTEFCCIFHRTNYSDTHLICDNRKVRGQKGGKVEERWKETKKSQKQEGRKGEKKKKGRNGRKPKYGNGVKKEEMRMEKEKKCNNVNKQNQR